MRDSLSFREKRCSSTLSTLSATLICLSERRQTCDFPILSSDLQDCRPRSSKAPLSVL